MRLQSYDRYSEIAEFDPESGVLEVKERVSDSGSSELYFGHFTRLGGSVAILYRDGDVLWLRLGNSTLKLDEHATVTWRIVGTGSAELAVSSVEDVVQVYPSELPVGVGLEEDITAFSSPEDWDFGLFVANVFNDVERRLRIYRNGEN